MYYSKIDRWGKISRVLAEIKNYNAHLNILMVEIQ